MMDRVELVDHVVEFGREPAEIGCLRVFLTLNSCFGPVVALGPPAAGDRLLELLPVRLGEGRRGVVDRPPAPCLPAPP